MNLSSFSHKKLHDFTSLLYGGEKQKVIQTNKLGLPFCGVGSPVHGCSTIGQVHSRNLLVSTCLRATKFHPARNLSVAPCGHRIRIRSFALYTGFANHGRRGICARRSILGLQEVEQ
jgi:hypothetical protein